MTPEQLKSTLTSDFFSFCRFFKPEFDWLKIQEVICDLVAKTALEPDGRLTLSIAPGIGKSTISSQLLPAWLLARNSKHRIIIASYGFTLSDYHGQQVRSLVQSEAFEYVFGRIVSRRGVTGDFSTDDGGFVICRGRDGAITGRRADCLILDDTIKNDKEATSEKVLAEVWSFFSKTAFTRLDRKSKGSMIAFNTRWTTRDLIGRLKNLYPDWRHINVEAIHTGLEPDILGREIGQGLGDNYMTLEELKLRQEKEPGTFNTLYQGNPIDASKSPIKKSSLILGGSIPRDRPKTIISWDTASTNNDTSDYTVATIWSINKDLAVLTQVYREKLEFPDLVNLFSDLDRKYNPLTHVVENASSGIQLLQLFPDATLPSKAFKSDEKFLIAELTNLLLRSGRLQILDGTLSDENITELCEFVYGEHDDILMSILHFVRSYQSCKPELWAIARKRARSPIRFKW